MKNHLTILFYLLLALALVACEQKDPYSGDLGFDYYPLEIGQWWEYQVDSVIYDPTSAVRIDSIRVFWREEIVDTLLDQAGQTLYVIDRFERPADTLPWLIKEVVTAGVFDLTARRTENNLQFIPLVFPLRADGRWDGNAFIDPATIVRVAGESLEMFKGWESTVESLGEPATVGSLSFSEVAAIALARNENLIELREVTERYARGVGLVAREMRILDTQTLDPLVAWEEKAEKGFILRQVLIDYPQ